MVGNQMWLLVLQLDVPSQFRVSWLSPKMSQNLEMYKKFISNFSEEIISTSEISFAENLENHYDN